MMISTAELASSLNEAGLLSISLNGGEEIAHIGNCTNGDLGIYLYNKPKELNFKKARKMVSPLVLDLDGDGIETIGVDQPRTFFNLDSDGRFNHFPV